MSYKTSNLSSELEAKLPPLDIPSEREITSEELEQRQGHLERAREIRAAIRAECGPLGMTAGELKHLARQEA